ncbi:hypothetical protein L208DRAFT_1404914 [Tricholoma matsutake]|nr:hypothetical protein L208DRAFT_1404914 [Tricholoma matsutake 945]
MVPPILDTEGYAVCPDCDSRVNCGTIGLANLEKHHHGKKISRKLADTLNGCLCRQVLDSSLNGVLGCKQVYMSSIIYNV